MPVAAEEECGKVSAPQPRSERKQCCPSKRKMGVTEDNTETMV